MRNRANTAILPPSVLQSMLLELDCCLLPRWPSILGRFVLLLPLPLRDKTPLRMDAGD